MTRMMVDCRTMPSESNCSLTIAGTEDEVVRAAVQHVVDVHGHEETPELREQVRASMVDATRGLGAEGAFVQLVEFRASEEQLAQGRQAIDRYREDIGDAATVRWAMTTADRDRAHTYVQIVQFPSYQDAMANSDHPATRQLAEQLEKLAEAPAVYRNLDVLGVEGEV